MYAPVVLETKASIPSFNNIATEQNWRDLIVDERTDSNIFFNVDIEPASNHLPVGMTHNDEQMVINLDDNHLIAFHGSKYSLLKNADAFDAVNNAVNNLAARGVLDLDGAFIKDAVVSKGGKVIRQWFFPAHKVLVGEGDSVILRLVVINSYDGSCNFQVQAGGFRIVCTNGLVTGEKFMSLSARHTGDIQLEHVTKKIETVVSSFKGMGLYWKQLIETPLSDVHADRIITELASDKGKVSMNKWNMFDALYNDHKRDLGANYWAMYNTLTAWSTHYKVNESNIANLENVRLQREDEVSHFLRNKLWEVAA